MTAPRFSGPFPARFLLLALLVVVTLVCITCQEPSGKARVVKRVTILTFNDLHGSLTPFTRFWGDKEQSGGIARMATVIREIRAENERQGADTLLFFAGDLVQGTPLSTAFKGEAEIAAMNLLAPNAAVIGNHDFDYGLDNLMALKKAAKFPFLGANIYNQRTDKLIFDPLQRFKTKHGVKVGVIGVTTDETPTTTHPSNVKDLRFVMPSLAIRRHLPDAQKSSDLLILVSHAGVKDDKVLAKDFPQLNVILGGHTHTKLDEPLHIGKTMVFQAGDRGLYLGRMDLEIEGKDVRMISAKLIPIRDHLMEDPELKAKMELFVKRLDVEVAKPIGRTNILLNGERSTIRSSETNLGDFIADLMRIRGEAQIAFINSGAIRSSIQPGTITLGAVMNALPMNNTLYTFTLSGAQVQELVQHSIDGLLAGGTDKPFGGFLQTSGLQVTMRNDRLESISVGGQALDLGKRYRCATVDFLMAGGDGYSVLQDARQIYDTGINLRDLFISGVSLSRPLNVRENGRFLRY